MSALLSLFFCFSALLGHDYLAFHPHEEIQELRKHKADYHSSAKPNKQDLIFLKKFFKRAELWGLYRHLKGKDRKYLTKLQALHKKYNLKTNHIEEVLEIRTTKPKRKLKRSINKSTFWQLELRSFLIKNQVIKYTPATGAILDQRGFRFQF